LERREYFTYLKLIHNEFQYAVFGRVTKGDDTLRKLERLPTRREGIFVMVCVAFKSFVSCTRPSYYLFN